LSSRLSDVAVETGLKNTQKVSKSISADALKMAAEDKATQPATKSAKNVPALLCSKDRLPDRYGSLSAIGLGDALNLVLLPGQHG
jgi:hypothetical protein